MKLKLKVYKIKKEETPVKIHQRFFPTLFFSLHLQIITKPFSMLNVLINSPVFTLFAHI